MNNNIFCFLFFIFLSIFGYGQVTILSKTEGREYRVREPFNFSIGLEVIGDNYKQQSPIKLPDLSKFDILGNAVETYESIEPETGLIVRQIIHHFILLPKYTGKVNIGSASVQFNGRVYKSESFDVIIKGDGNRLAENERSKVSLMMEMMSKEVYENQPINIVVKLKTENNNYDDFRRINNIKLPNNIKKDIHPISLKRQDIELNKEYDIATQVIASFVIVPEKLGDMIINPTIAYYNEDKILSNPLKLNVKKLPNGAPSSFKNAVGKFDIDIETLEYNAEINQPIDVFVKLSGIGNLNNIKLPQILESDDYTLFKPKQKPNFKVGEEGFLGEIKEHYVILPKKEGEINIKLEEFSYFDIDKNKYINIDKKNFRLNSINNNVDEKKSTIGNIVNNTGHILKKINLQPKSTEKQEENNNIKIIIGIVFLFFIALSGIYILVFNKKDKKNISEITTNFNDYAEKIIIDKDYYFNSLKKSLEIKDDISFFSIYSQMHNEVQKQVLQKKYENISEFIELRFDEKFLEEYNDFCIKMEIEKYSPMRQDLDGIYDEIIKIYSKIIE